MIERERERERDDGNQIWLFRPMIQMDKIVGKKVNNINRASFSHDIDC